MSSRRQMLEFLSLSRLPSAYQEVEYIESSGTQYIDTLWIPTSNSKVRIKFQFNQVLSHSDNSIFGLREGSNRYNLYVYQDLNYLSIGYGTSYNENTLSIVANQDYDVIFIANGTNATLSGDLSKTATSSSEPVFTQSLYLFNRNGQTSFTSSSKIKVCQIYDNSVLVRNFVPCYRKADNEIGLYDLVNRKFYTNAGTGTFTKGSDI